VREHPPGSGPGEGVEQILAADRREAVGVARADHQRRRPDEHVAVDVLGEVHAEERQRRVGHGIDQRAHQLSALGHEPQVGAAERHDPRVGVGAGGDREAVGPRACAEDRVARLGRCRGRAQAQRTPR
jgi:hypothetical protein